MVIQVAMLLSPCLSCPDYKQEKIEMVEGREELRGIFNPKNKKRKKITHLNIVQLPEDLEPAEGRGLAKFPPRSRK